MVNFLGLLKSDFYKMKNTAFYKIHSILPIIGSAIFLMYFFTHTNLNQHYSANGKVQTFIQVLSLAFPFLTSIVTSYIIEIEKECGNYKEILGSSSGRCLTILSKIAVLIICGFCSLFLALGIFVIGISLSDKTIAFNLNDFIAVCLILLGSELFIYLLHIALNLIFNKGFSILVGVGESVLAAIMLTGLGEGIWMYVPSGLEVRLIGYYLLKISQSSLYKSIEVIFHRGIFISVIYTLVFLIILLLYFKHYEAKSNM